MSQVSRLLLTRLRRSMMRSKLRVFAVVAIVTFATYAGVMMAEHARNASLIYDDFYNETNLADLIITDVEQPRDNFTRICDPYADWSCESRLVLQGQTYHSVDNTSKWIQSQWLGLEDATISGLYSIEGSTTAGAGEIVIDAHAARGLNYKIGDEIRIIAGNGTIELTIVGFANSPLHLWYAPEGVLFPVDDGYVVGYLDAEYLASISGLEPLTRNQLHIDLPGTPSFDYAETADINEGQQVSDIRLQLVDEIRLLDMEGNVVDRGGMNGPELLRLDLEGTKKSAPFILAVLLIVSGLMIAISISRLVKSQSREIAVLRTIGASGKEIMSGYLLMPLVLGIPGVIIGILLGISPIGSQLLTEFYFDFFGVPIVIVRHYPDLLLKIGLGSVFLLSLFGIRPALTASRLQPLDILNRTSQKPPSKIMVKITSLLPVGPSLAIRSTFRNPSRLIATLVMLSLSMVIMGGTMMMTASFEELFEETMDEQENWHAQAYLWPMNIDEAESWAQQNASSYELLIRSNGNASGDSRTFTIYGLDKIVDDESAMHRFNVIQGALPISGQTPPQVLIDEGMADQLDWSISDIVTYSQGSATIEVEVKGIVRELERTMVFYRTDYSSIAGWEANGIRLTFDEGQQLDDEVRSLTSVVVTKEELLIGFEEILKQQESAMMSTYVIGAIMAVTILFNTLMMNLAERDSELATLRVLGASVKDLAIILTIEHAFIGLVGGIAGVAASILMFQGLASAFSTWQFFMPVTIDTMVSLQVLLFIFLASIVTTPFGMWRIKKMDLLDVVSRHQN